VVRWAALLVCWCFSGLFLGLLALVAGGSGSAIAKLRNKLRIPLDANSPPKISPLRAPFQANNGRTFGTSSYCSDAAGGGQQSGKREANGGGVRTLLEPLRIPILTSRFHTETHILAETVFVQNLTQTMWHPGCEFKLRF